MTLTVNGQSRSFAAIDNLAQLLETLGVTVGKMAVELNGRIIPSSAFAATPITADDQIEIIQFVGGG